MPKRGGPWDESSFASLETFVLPGFKNVSGQTITLPPGWFRAHVVGDIEVSPAPGSGQVDSTQVEGVLNMTYNGVTSTASARQFASTSCPGCEPDSGPETTTYQHGFYVLAETGGAVVQVDQDFLAIPGGEGLLDMELVMPQIVLAPGESFTWWFQLRGITNSGPTGGGATVDFFEDTRLSITLPPGFTPNDLEALDGTPGSSFAWLSVAAPPVPGLGDPALVAGALTLLLTGTWFATRRAQLG